MIWGPLIGAAGSILGGIIGGRQARSADEASAEAIQKGIKYLENIGIPSIEAQKIVLEAPKLQGWMNPQYAQYTPQGSTELNKISLDPAVRQAQLSALDRLRQQEQGGFTLGEQADLDQLMRQIAADEAAKRAAIQQQMARRGLSGGALELAAKLQNQQAAADRAGLLGLQQAGLAAQRGMNATMARANLGGQLEDRMFAEQARKYGAQDMINRFNKMNEWQAAQNRANAANKAQYYNLGQRQRIAEAGAGLRNQQEMYNKGLIQQRFANQLGLGSAMRGAQSDLARMYANQAQNTKDMWGNIIQGGAKIAASAFGGNEKKKKD